MRPATAAPPRPLLALALVPALAGLVAAKPYPKDDLHDVGFSYLMQRGCDSYCGSDNQFCCGSGETCTTLDNNVATCVGGGGGGYYGGAYTTTWTRTYTSTIFTEWIPVPQPTEGVDCIPKNDQQEACGEICCAGWQSCAFKGQCSPRPGYDEPTTVIVTASNGQVTTQYSAPYRVTATTTVVTSGEHTGGAGGAATASSTESSAGATGTADGDSDGGSGGTGGHGLSGGAIAGIVIGTLFGLGLLFLLAFCCIARGLWHALFGRKKDKRERVDITEERYSRHGSRAPSAYSRRDHHSGWFGGKPSSGQDRREKKSSSGKWWLGLAGAAATLLALLNLRKDKKPPPRRSNGGRSRYSNSYYSYSDGSSPSSSSSGKRTHRTRQSRYSDNSGSRYTRRSRR